MNKRSRSRASREGIDRRSRHRRPDAGAGGGEKRARRPGAHRSCAVRGGDRELKSRKRGLARDFAADAPPSLGARAIITISAIAARAGLSARKRRPRFATARIRIKSGRLEFDADSPIAWELSADALGAFVQQYPGSLGGVRVWRAISRKSRPTRTGVVIVKHNNPCGVALVPKRTEARSRRRRWKRSFAPGKAIRFRPSAECSFSRDPLEEETAAWLAETIRRARGARRGSRRARPSLRILLAKRQESQGRCRSAASEACRARRVVSFPAESCIQSSDTGLAETLKSVTKTAFPAANTALSKFGIAVCRALKSNAIALVREIPGRRGSAARRRGPGPAQSHRGAQGARGSARAGRAERIPAARSANA